MSPVLQTKFPLDMVAERGLPGIAPVTGDILLVDDAYAGQMKRRRSLIETHRDKVMQSLPDGQAAALELLHFVLQRLPALGYDVHPDSVLCPDNVIVPVDQGDPLTSLGRICQADFCVLEQGPGDEHVMTGAVLCFPASWTLQEKIGRPLTGIHVPVAEYDAGLARRVQRLFDGIQVDRPIWRFNRLWYVDAELYQPRSEQDQRSVPHSAPDADFVRTERQTLVRLPKSRAVIFVIHTYVLARENVPEQVLAG